MSKLPNMQKSPLSVLEQFQSSSYLADNNAGYIESIYENFLKDPNSVDETWRQYFQSLLTQAGAIDFSHSDIRQQFALLAARPQAVQIVTSANNKQDAVNLLIDAYRRYGHIQANINPLNKAVVAEPRLQMTHYGLTATDLNDTFDTQGVLEEKTAPLQKIIQQLQQIYCGAIGIEFDHITSEVERDWLKKYIEHRSVANSISEETKRHILRQLVAAETLEKYLDSKYVGQVRFSLEGNDSLIPLLDALALKARQQQIEEIVICMAHRGRLNVLLNIMGQSPAELFQEFEGKKDFGPFSGDVKYHRGYSRDVKTDDGAIHLSLAFNPSHLEYVCPVAMGSVRARQERAGVQKADYAMTVMIHGDAAFAGEGIVMETLSMSQTRAFYVGGSIHIVLNNQIGFTTSYLGDARSTYYCTDLAKMLDAPIFHVNSDDPEAALFVGELALNYRNTFHKDVFIDLVGYRRHGHQEADDPVPTSPKMYDIIEKHPSVRSLYATKLIEQKICSTTDIEAWTKSYRDHLDQGRQVVETIPGGLSQHYQANWTPYINQHWRTAVDTSVAIEKLSTISEVLNTVPPQFALHRKIAAVLEARRQMISGNLPLDWGCGEMMAYASLLTEGYPVRFSGEDSRRGTFFHRHAVVYDQNTGEAYNALAHLSDKQAHVSIYDSLLSEAGAMGFEYGYATAAPKSLVIWEAQFGDFANVAQVIIDQFISSGWQKWGRLAGLILYLPHGYEGKGPEHSSARLERFLQLCAEDNMQVCVPTTPAQIFHLVRRQVLRPYRTPLIVMTPKSLLRNKLAVSPVSSLAEGHFEVVIPEIDPLNSTEIKRVILCSGKVYYELLTERRQRSLNHIAIIRIEQLYPFPDEELKMALATYLHVKDVIWCQEEPKNQGAWLCTRDALLQCLQPGQSLTYVGPDASASPAPGYMALFQKQQTALIKQALDLEEA